MIFGLGYSGLRLARECLAAGWAVSGTARSQEKVAYLTAQLGDQGVGIHAFTQVGDLSLDAVRTITHVVDTTVPDENGSSVPPEMHRLAEAGICPQWAGYISTTAVYGDCGGAWVTEDIPANPASKQGYSRLKGETQWLDWGANQGVPTHIFRLPGLYGPGRCALDQVMNGRARRVYREGHRTSRVHVDDVNAALRLSMAAPDAGRVYNVADDSPAPTVDVVTFACELLNRQPPPLERYEDLAPDDPRLRFLRESRLVSNARLKAELKWTPQYPTYREGLLHALKVAPPSPDASRDDRPQI
jgi:nucleoside-diphosphate-sugar epimerase